jgi:hypothetical protein
MITMTYSFPQKDHWRNRIWNIIAKRINVHPRDAVILYLAAQEDLDRFTALRKGFKTENLIAVDRDPVVVNAIRNAGHLAICGDILDVIESWPDRVPVAAVIADFTCGLEMRLAMEFDLAARRKVMKDTLFVVNLMRGRDASSNWIRECLGSGDTKDRVRVLIHSAINRWMHDLIKLRGDPRDSTIRAGAILAHRCLSKAIFGHYQSSRGMYFDWGIFHNPFAPIIEMQGNGPDKGRRGSCDLARSISAVLAHRTMRLAA